MSRSVLSVFFFPLSTLSTLENWADCAKASVCISRRPAFPTTQLSSPSMLRVYWSKQNESQDGHIEVSCDWLRWYSTESELLSKMTISSFFFFFFVWTRCIVVPQFIPPRPQVGGVRGVRSRMEWRTCFLSLQWERENETEREKVLPIRPSIRVLSTHSSTPPNPGAAAMPIGEQEERGGAGSTDQGSVAISQCIDQWSGAVSGSSPSSPLHLPQSPPPNTPPITFQRISEQQDLQTEVPPPGPPLSEDDAAAAQTLATSMYRRRGRHRGKVGVDLDLWKVGLCREEVCYYQT